MLLDGSDNAAALYEAAVKVKELLRERAALLLLDRLDIAAAVGAEGVVLSPTGTLDSVCVVVWLYVHMCTCDCVYVCSSRMCEVCQEGTYRREADSH